MVSSERTSLHCKKAQKRIEGLLDSSATSLQRVQEIFSRADQIESNKVEGHKTTSQNSSDDDELIKSLKKQRTILENEKKERGKSQGRPRVSTYFMDGSLESEFTNE